MIRPTTTVSIRYAWSQPEAEYTFRITAECEPGSRGSHDEPPHGPSLDDVQVSLESVGYGDGRDLSGLIPTNRDETEKQFEAALDRQPLCGIVEGLLFEAAEEKARNNEEAR